MTVVFAERRETLHLLDSGAGPKVERGRYRGLGAGTEAPGRETWRYRALPLPPGQQRAAGFGAADDPAIAALGAPWPAEYAGEEALRALAAAVRAAAADRPWRGVVISLRQFDQQVLAGPPDRLRADRRRFGTVNLRVVADGPRGPRTLRRDAATADPTALEGLTRQMVDQLDAALEGHAVLPELSLPPARRPVLLAPGSCALFFHELCGHPLEGDVAESGTSYLARHRDSDAGPSWLTVLDDPTAPAAPFGYRHDDEGTRAHAVPLIDGGVVRGLVHSRSSARAAGEPANGHGRRMSYLYPAVPRQAHTRVLPGPSTADEVAGGPGETVRIERMRVRHVHQASGAFSFLGLEGTLLHGGEPVGRLTDVLVEGDGLAALRDTVAVGADSLAWVGGGGCGKLDQGPLIVGFEQPSVRIAGLHTRSVAVAHGERTAAP